MRQSDTRPKIRLKQPATETASLPARFDGRFLAPDRREYSCRTIDMSADFIAVHRVTWLPSSGNWPNMPMSLPR